MADTKLEDYEWLVSEEAQRWLTSATDPSQTLVNITLALRREIGPSRTHLVVALVATRRRAKEKFRDAERMFFTRELLEQATDQWIAAYKAERFPAGAKLTDLCCGAGGDLLALARRGSLTGVDCDPVAVLLAENNCQLQDRGKADFCVEDAANIDVTGFQAWHIDPDRRISGQRSVDMDHHEPDRETVEELLSRNANAAVKLAPACAVPEPWQEQAELEWIGSRGECRQLVAWFGDLARYRGQHAATIVPTDGSPACTVTGTPGVDVSAAEALGEYLYEPHAAVLTSRLAGSLATSYDLAPVAQGIDYLTGDALVDHPALSRFHILEVMPFDVRQIRKEVRRRGIGQVEVKKRGFKVPTEQVAAEVRGKGDAPATLLLYRSGKRAVAVLAQRVETNSDTEGS